MRDLDFICENCGFDIVTSAFHICKAKEKGIHLAGGDKKCGNL